MPLLSNLLRTGGPKYPPSLSEYKYSVVLFILADLVREGRISLDELQGLSENKLHCIRDHQRHTRSECNRLFSSIRLRRNKKKKMTQRLQVSDKSKLPFS